MLVSRAQRLGTLCVAIAGEKVELVGERVRLSGFDGFGVEVSELLICLRRTLNAAEGEGFGRSSIPDKMESGSILLSTVPFSGGKASEGADASTVGTRPSWKDAAKLVSLASRNACLSSSSRLFGLDLLPSSDSGVWLAPVKCSSSCGTGKGIASSTTGSSGRPSLPSNTFNACS